MKQMKCCVQGPWPTVGDRKHLQNLFPSFWERPLNKRKLGMAAPKILKRLVPITVMFLGVTEVHFDAYESNPNDIRRGMLTEGKAQYS
jgi:hypothetical protein